MARERLLAISAWILSASDPHIYPHSLSPESPICIHNLPSDSSLQSPVITLNVACSKRLFFFSVQTHTFSAAPVLPSSPVQSLVLTISTHPFLCSTSLLFLASLRLSASSHRLLLRSFYWSLLSPSLTPYFISSFSSPPKLTIYTRIDHYSPLKTLPWAVCHCCWSP